MLDELMRFRKWPQALAVLLVLAIAAFGCAKSKGTTPAEKRNYTLDMREDTLEKLYAKEPEARKNVESSSGYGVFSNMGMNLLVLSSGNGFGVVRDNSTKQDVFMKMQQLGVGLGVGAKEFQAVILFHSPEALDAFTTKGWEWGGSADAAGKSEAHGGAASGNANVQKDMEVYLMTEKGVALQATANGTKYWPDDELNAEKAKQ